MNLTNRISHLQSTPKPQNGETKSVPRVEIVSDTSKTIRGVITALGKCRGEDGAPIVYQRGGKLVHITCPPESKLKHVVMAPESPQIAQLCENLIWAKTNTACRLYEEKVNADGEIREVIKQPPARMCRAVRGWGSFAGVPDLNGIVQCPTLRADGTPLQEPGYDVASGLFYYDDGKTNYPKIPTHPTKADAAKAAEKLLDLVCDFPFADEHHRSVWLAMVLTMVARPLIAGPTPMFVFDANTRGSGKSLLVDAAHVIAHGKPAARQSYPRRDEEMQKLITAIARAGGSSVLFDNIETGYRIGCGSLDAALTSETWQARKLATSEITGEIPMRLVWVATGNNVGFKADTARRVVYCRLESPDENPEERTGFKHKALLEHVRTHRGQLVVAALTIMRAWHCAADRNVIEDDTADNYRDWSSKIRQAIVWCGQADFAATKADVKDEDSSADELRMLHDGLRAIGIDEERGITSAELLTEYQREGCPREWRDAVDLAVAGLVTARKIGVLLTQHKGRVCDGWRVSFRRWNSRRAWLIESLNSPTEGLPPPDGAPKPECENHDATLRAPHNQVAGDKLFCCTCGKFLGRVNRDVGDRGVTEEF